MPIGAIGAIDALSAGAGSVQGVSPTSYLGAGKRTIA